MIASFALAYRVIEGRAGFIDVYAGGRYNYMGLDLFGSISRSGVQQVSDSISTRVVDGVANRVILLAALRDFARDDIELH